MISGVLTELVDMARQLKHWAWQAEEYNILQTEARLEPELLAGLTPDGGRVELLRGENEAFHQFIKQRYIPPRADPGLYLAKMRGRLRQGDHLYLLTKDGQPQGWIWATWRSYMMEALQDLAPEPGETVFYDVFMLPEHRGGGRYAWFFRCAEAFEAAQGARLISLVVMSSNPASLKAHLHAGVARVAMRAWLVRALGIQRQRRQRGPWPLAEAIGAAASRPTAALRALGLFKQKL